LGKNVEVFHTYGWGVVGASALPFDKKTKSWGLYGYNMHTFLTTKRLHFMATN